MRSKDWDDARSASVADAAEEFFGSSKSFVDWLRVHHPRLQVPEREIVYAGLGAPSHTWCEIPPAPGEPCPKCGPGWVLDGPQPRVGPPRLRWVEERLAISWESLICCPRCQRSGFEWELRRQLDLAGLPPREPVRKAHKANKRAGRPAKRPRGRRWMDQLQTCRARVPRSPR